VSHWTTNRNPSVACIYSTFTTYCVRPSTLDRHG